MQPFMLMYPLFAPSGNPFLGIKCQIRRLKNPGTSDGDTGLVPPDFNSFGFCFIQVTHYNIMRISMPIC